MKLLIVNPLGLTQWVNTAVVPVLPLPLLDRLCGEDLLLLLLLDQITGRGWPVSLQWGWDQET